MSFVIHPPTYKKRIQLSQTLSHTNILTYLHFRLIINYFSSTYAWPLYLRKVVYFAAVADKYQQSKKNAPIGGS